TRRPRLGCRPWPTPATTARVSASTCPSSSPHRDGTSISIPAPQRAAPLPTLPGRTRVHAGQRPLAHPAAHHRQRRQDRRHRPPRTRPHPFRAWLHQMKFVEITALATERGPFICRVSRTAITSIPLEYRVLVLVPGSRS